MLVPSSEGSLVCSLSYDVVKSGVDSCRVWFHFIYDINYIYRK